MELLGIISCAVVANGGKFAFDLLHRFLKRTPAKRAGVRPFAPLSNAIKTELGPTLELLWLNETSFETDPTIEQPRFLEFWEPRWEGLRPLRLSGRWWIQWNVFLLDLVVFNKVGQVNGVRQCGPMRRHWWKWAQNGLENGPENSFWRLGNASGLTRLVMRQSPTVLGRQMAQTSSKQWSDGHFPTRSTQNAVQETKSAPKVQKDRDKTASLQRKMGTSPPLPDVTRAESAPPCMLWKCYTWERGNGLSNKPVFPQPIASCTNNAGKNLKLCLLLPCRCMPARDRPNKKSLSFFSTCKKACRVKEYCRTEGHARLNVQKQ